MLFKSTLELSKFAPISHTVNFDNLKTIIEDVEEDQILDVLGKELYDELLEGLKNEENMQDSMKKLSNRCRKVVAPQVVYIFTPLTEVKLSDAGAQRSASQNLQTAYQNQVVNFREQCYKNYSKALEKLYEYLETNIATFTNWKNSPGYKEFNSLFIKSGSDFHAQIATSAKYRNYYAIRSFMADVENSTIKNLLGAELFAYLKDPDTTLTDAEKKLISLVKKATAFLSVRTALPFLDVRLDGNGFTVMNDAFAQDDAQTKRWAADSARINQYLDALQRLAASYVNQISDWLKDNNIDQKPVIVTETDNRNRKSLFGFF